MNSFIDPFDHMVVNQNSPFSWDNVFSRPTDLDAIKTNGEGRSVGVVGGGIAGLVLAYELHVRGYKVTIFEKSDRCGGRIRTHRFSDAAYGELGAFRIPMIHKAVYEYLDLFDIPTRPFIFWNPYARLYFNGIHGSFWPTSSNAGEAVKHFTRLREAFPGMKRVTESGIAAGPQSLLFSLLVEPFMKEFTNDGSKWAFFRKGKITDLQWKFQTTKLVDYATSDYIGLSQADWEFLSRTTGVGPLRDCTVAQFFFDMLPVITSNMVEVVGGMDQLIDAFLQRIKKDNVVVNFEVKKVTVGQSRVAVTGQTDTDQSQTRYFDFVVLAVPPISLQKIKFGSPKSLSSKMDAIRSLQMGPLAKSLIFSREPFWSQSELFRGFAGFCATDLDILQVWFPDRLNQSQCPLELFRLQFSL